MSDELKCIHGITGLAAIQECNQSLGVKIDKILDLLSGFCEYETGDGYYLSQCGYSYSNSDEPQCWKFCPRCGRKICKSIEPHG